MDSIKFAFYLVTDIVVEWIKLFFMLIFVIGSCVLAYWFWTDVLPNIYYLDLAINHSCDFLLEHWIFSSLLLMIISVLTVRNLYLMRKERLKKDAQEDSYYSEEKYQSPYKALTSTSLLQKYATNLGLLDSKEKQLLRKTLENKAR